VSAGLFLTNFTGEPWASDYDRGFEDAVVKAEESYEPPEAAAYFINLYYWN
jgi:hypothetical protein